MKKYQSFLPENFRFLEVKFSIYLNKRVFVMLKFYHVRTLIKGLQFTNHTVRTYVQSDHGSQCILCPQNTNETTRNSTVTKCSLSVTLIKENMRINPLYD